MRPNIWVIGLVLALGSRAWSEQATVVLIPLKPLAETSNTAWIAEGIAQNLLNELGRFAYARPMVLKDQVPVGTPEDAASVGKMAAAKYALFGSYQLSETEIRITAQVVKVDGGKMIGAIRATGAMRDLFSLEDSIADQLKRVLKTELAPEPAAAAAPAQPVQPPAIQPNGPLPNPQDQRDQELIDRARMRFDNPDYWYNRYNYGYPSYYGYYGYGYPYFYLPWYWRGFYRGPVVSPVPTGIGRDPRRGFGNSVGYYPMTLSTPKQ